MAIGAARQGGMPRSARHVMSGSTGGRWIDAHDDLETADTANAYLDPENIATSGFHWIRRPEGATRVLLRGAITAAATPSTAPVVVLLGMDGEPNSSGAFSGAAADANYGSPMRLDNADNDAAGITLTLLAAANAMSDDAWDYTDITTLDGYDVKGVDYVGVFVVTAAGAFTGTAKAQIRFLN